MTKMKFSNWIRLAVGDVKKVVRSPLYEFDLDTWHVPWDRCKVCFTGAKMMGLGADHKKDLRPSNFKEENQLEALNFLRYGYINRALILYYGKVYKKLQTLANQYENKWYYVGILTPYQRIKFYKDMLGFADELEKLGY